MGNPHDIRASSIDHFAKKHGSDMMVVIADTSTGYKVLSSGSPDRKGEAKELADKLMNLLNID